MATRLYPTTTNAARLEQLAGVPAGTHARLAAFEATRPQDGMVELDAWYDVLFSDVALTDMHNFTVFGWGRLQCDVSQMNYDNVCGSTSNSDEMVRILVEQGVVANLDVCEGLCWS